MHFPFGAYLVPIVALLIPLAAIIGALVVKLERTRLQHETLRRLADSGQPIPPALLQGDESWQQALGSVVAGRQQLRTGAINIALGLGLMVMFYLMQAPGGGWMWSIGCIPLFIGIAVLIVWAIERKNRPSG